MSPGQLLGPVWASLDPPTPGSRLDLPPCVWGSLCPAGLPQGSAGRVLCPLVTCRGAFSVQARCPPGALGFKEATAATGEGPAGLPGMVLGPHGAAWRLAAAPPLEEELRHRSSRGRWSRLQDVREALPVLRGPCSGAFLSRWPSSLSCENTGPGSWALWFSGCEHRGTRGGGPQHSTELALPCFAPRTPAPARTPGRCRPSCTPGSARSGAGPSALR